MNLYTLGGLLLAFVLWSGFMYHAGGGNEKTLCRANDATAGLTQANGAIKTIGNQQAITTGVSNEYETTRRIIDGNYSGVVVRVQPLPGNGGVDTFSGSAGRPNGKACKPQSTSYYKLSSKECDENTAQLIGLQEWIEGQEKLAINQSPSPVPSAP